MEIQQTEMFEISEEPSPRLMGRLYSAARRYVYAGVGALAVTAEKAGEFRHEKIEKGIDRLAERGEREKASRLKGFNDGVQMTRDMAAGMGKQMVNVAGTTAGSMSGIVRDRIGIADSADVERVTQQIDELNTRLESAMMPVTEGELA